MSAMAKDIHAAKHTGHDTSAEVRIYLTIFGALAVLTLLAWSLDWIAGAIGAQRFGASRYAVVGATIGAVVGLFFALPGILLGPFLGAVIGELIARRDLEQAGRAGIGAWLGLLLGIAAKLALSLSMIAIFVFARIWQAR